MGLGFKAQWGLHIFRTLKHIKIQNRNKSFYHYQNSKFLGDSFIGIEHYRRTYLHNNLF